MCNVVQLSFHITTLPNRSYNTHLRSRSLASTLTITMPSRVAFSKNYRRDYAIKGLLMDGATTNGRQQAAADNHKAKVNELSHEISREGTRNVADVDSYYEHLKDCVQKQASRPERLERSGLLTSDVTRALSNLWKDLVTFSPCSSNADTNLHAVPEGCHHVAMSLCPCNGPERRRSTALRE